ncbi:hypothetical protein PQ455_01985 [Sphingomonas naphthae]|uniref:SPOR domain-containing protein n=1 Tax=Sphingomonas naphthae TaxID=1813468 RepID=A0ABY7TLA8_9SPHN|nr:hypothetical protein [Sphingomonas naphthae]WCT74026.1 hypothetical protein PQ455_01985 [Sphingomonas naphthae]
MIQRRVRAGITGLACVFLIVLMAAAFLNIARDRGDGDDIGANMAAGNTIAVEAPKDPLAELGVAPDAAPEPVQVAPNQVAPPAPKAAPAR